MKEERISLSKNYELEPTTSKTVGGKSCQPVQDTIEIEVPKMTQPISSWSRLVQEPKKPLVDKTELTN